MPAGRIAGQEHIIDNTGNLSFEEIGILVVNPHLISACINLEWDGRIYQVWIQEKIRCWEPKFIKRSERSAFSSSATSSCFVEGGAPAKSMVDPVVEESVAGRSPEDCMGSATNTMLSPVPINEIINENLNEGNIPCTFNKCQEPDTRSVKVVPPAGLDNDRREPESRNLISRQERSKDRRSVALDEARARMKVSKSQNFLWIGGGGDESNGNKEAGMARPPDKDLGLVEEVYRRGQEQNEGVEV
ncbi:hypothetical protein L1987_39391 [Smallanthus sonchifolius]|uniref:Uncharacterized protein n=1 Tax=Smallanthus sonchifolius TaxID=185202 RepID=A0ACB9HM72_9ASTR|nr:hypothetical protein L1987_39391 [Smallanthus sonchifolius]